MSSEQAASNGFMFIQPSVANALGGEKTHIYALFGVRDFCHLNSRQAPQVRLVPASADCAFRGEKTHVKLVTEDADAGKYHSQTGGIGSINHGLITHGATGLDDGRGTRRGGF